MKPVPTFPSPLVEAPKRLRLFANVVVSTLALAAILGLVNYLSIRHFRTWSVSAGSRPVLSSQTLFFLDSMTNDVNVVVFYDRNAPLYGAIKDLLEEYERRNSRLSLELVDNLYLGRVLEMEKKLKLEPGTPPNRIVFESGGRKRIVYESELSEYDYTAMLRQEEVKRKAFRGEQLFTTSIYTVIDPRPVKAYFLQRHNEHDPGSKNDIEGYSSFAGLLTDNSISWAPWETLSQGLPKDCQLLIVAGPTDDLSAEEADRLGEYLNQGGRLFFLCPSGAPTPRRFTQALASWGVELGTDFVPDTNHHFQNQPLILAIGAFADHPAVKSLRSRVLYMPWAKAVRQKSISATGAGAPTVTELAFTGGPSNSGMPANGGVPVIAAVQRGAIQGLASDRGATRLLVAGSSMFLGNVALSQAANRDLASHAVNWLLTRDELLKGIPSRPIHGYRVTLSDTEMTAVRWILLGLLPGVALCFSLITWVRRRA